jgi:hypothetical protein
VPTTRVITHTAARKSGLSEVEVSRRLRRGQRRGVFRGVYLPAHEPLTVPLAAQAALAVCPPGAAVSHQTACVLHGARHLDHLVRRCVDGDDEPPYEIHITVARDAPDVSPRPGLVVHRGQLTPRDVTRVSGLAVTTAVRSVLDVARHLPRLPAVVAADATLNAGACTLADLHAALPALTGWRNVRRAREVVGQAEPGAQSPGETQLRMIMVDGGFPRPVAQHPVRDIAGWVVAALDLAHVRWRLGEEYDGRDAHTRVRDFEHDRRRQNALRRYGWYPLRFTSRDLRSPGYVLYEVRQAAAAAEAGYAPPPPARDQGVV